MKSESWELADARRKLHDQLEAAQEREKRLWEFVHTWEALQLAYRDGRDEDVYVLSEDLDKQAIVLAKEAPRSSPD